MIDLTGQQFGSYRLVRRLGRGGFASVYLGQHIRLTSKQAAIKVLDLRDVDEEQFQQEAETTEQLKHPNIISLLDFDIQQGTPFLVLDYAPGGSLRTRHPKGSRIPLATVIGYLKQIAPALQYAHDQRNIIHRDIKPDNMLIGRQGELLLSDFGISLLSRTGKTSPQSSASTGGTPYYMAPEQFRGKPEKASDQYALATVVYKWLAGTTPFHEGDCIQLGYQHVHEPVPPLRDAVPELSVNIESVIVKALSKQPQDRYPSVQAFVQALEQASQDLLPTEKMRHGISSSPVSLSPSSSAINTVTSDQLPGSVSSSQQPATPPSAPTTFPANPSTSLPSASTPSFRQAPASAPPLNRPPTPSQKPPRPINPSVPLSSTSTPFLQQPPVLASPAGQPATPPLTPIRPTNPPANLPPPVTPIPSTQPQSPSPEKTIATSKISRRAVLIGAAGVVAVAGVGTALFAMTHQPSARDLPLPTTTPQNQPFTYRGHSSYVKAVAWSPDGRMLASASYDKSVQVWEAGTGKQLRRYEGHYSYVNAVAWFPDGRMLASASDGVVQVWEAGTGKQLRRYEGHSNTVWAVVWSPDGRMLASASDDETVRVWEAGTGKQLRCYEGHSREVLAVAWSPDGRMLASASDGVVQVWEAGTGKQLRRYEGHSNWVRAVAWSPDGRVLASASGNHFGSSDHTVQVWEVGTGKQLRRYEGHSNTVWVVAWSPDGKMLASASSDKSVQVWEVGTGKQLRRYEGHSDWVRAVTWSPDGRMLASASDDGTVRVWEGV